VAGFAFADVHDAGVAFCAVTTDDAAAAAALARLAATAWDLRATGAPAEDDIDDILARDFFGVRGPVVLVEPADNIGGGAPGDCTDVLRGLLRANVANAGVILNDADAVASLADARPGEVRRLALGGRGSRLDPGPVTLDAMFVSRSDGRFMLEDRQSHLVGGVGMQIDMGPCAVVRHGGITILLTSHKTPPFDLGQWRSQGIDPETFAFIGVKAAVAHRGAYEPIQGASFTLRTRGPCMSDLTALPYAKLRRPIFPLDPETPFNP
jgi:microcystin degradation protein MlrC